MPNNLGNSINSENNDLTFMDLFKVIFGNIRIIFSISLAISILAYGATYFLTPLYSAKLIFLPVPPPFEGQQYSSGSAFGGISKLAGLNLQADSPDVTLNMAILNSRSFLEEFLKQNHVIESMYANKWNAKTQNWKAEYAQQAPSLVEAVEKFQKEVLSIQPTATSGIYSLNISWSDPKLASAWANALILDANKHIRDVNVYRAQDRLNFLEKQLEVERTSEIRVSITNLVGLELRTLALAQNNNEYAFRVIDDAAVPTHKVSPKRVIITLLVFFSVFLALSFYFIVRRKQ